MPARTATPKLKARTDCSSASLPARATAAGAAATSAPLTILASSSPATPPVSERSTLSTSSCRTSLHPEQPSAARTASSVSRAAPRERKRLATLTHAMISSRPTAPRRSTASARRCQSCPSEGERHLRSTGSSPLCDSAACPPRSLPARPSPVQRWLRLQTADRAQVVVVERIGAAGLRVERHPNLDTRFERIVKIPLARPPRPGTASR